MGERRENKDSEKGKKIWEGSEKGISVGRRNGEAGKEERGGEEEARR